MKGGQSLNRLLSFESFVTAVQAGSISAAADRLGTTKSNVSRRIAELEAHLGLRLLNRNPRRLTTTGVGGEFYKQLSRLLGELKSAEQHVADQATEPCGVLRITCPSSFASMHFKSLAARLMLRHPKLSLDLDCEDRVTDFVTSGHDCAVRPRPCHSPDLHGLVPPRERTFADRAASMGAAWGVHFCRVPEEQAAIDQAAGPDRRDGRGLQFNSRMGSRDLPHPDVTWREAALSRAASWEATAAISVREPWPPATSTAQQPGRALLRQGVVLGWTTPPGRGRG